MRKHNYEPDDQTFSADAYKVKGHGGIAWYVMGWEIGQAELEFKDQCHECRGTGETEDDDGDIEPCEVCQGKGEICYYEWEDVQTGMVVCRMVGDDQNFVFDKEDIEPLERGEYCGECGQIGCAHDGYDREEVEG